MDFIPKVKLDYQPEEDIEQELTNEETEEVEPNFVYEEEEEVNINPSMNGMNEDKGIDEETIFEDIPKKKKTRKPMTEEHKAKLKLAREKANAVRRAKGQENRKLKQMKNETKELQKLKIEKEYNKVKHEVEKIKDPPKPAPAPAPEPEPKQVHNQLTKEDIEEAQLQAIMKYEALRKERKKNKKINEAEEQRKTEMRNKLLRAMNPRNNYSNFATGGF